MGFGNEGRTRADSVEGHSLQERERKGHPRTERRLMFDEIPQSAMGTTNNVENPDDSITNFVGDQDLRRKRLRAEQEISEDYEIRPSKPAGSKGVRAEGTRSSSALDR